MTTTLDLPLLADADVVVAGGGPSGVAAALAAARAGHRTVLLEQTVALGGLGTSGLVPMFSPTSDGMRMLYGGIFAEVVEELCRRMGRPVEPDTWQAIDPEHLKALLDEKVADAGVTVFFQAKVCRAEVADGRIGAVWCATSMGLKRVTGRQFVDATGDGLLAMLSGAGFDVGDADGRTMSPTLCAQFANIDHAAANSAAERGDHPAAIWHRMLADGTAPLPERHFVCMKEVREGVATSNLGHLYGLVCLDEAERTRGLMEGRRIARVFETFFREHVPGYERVALVNTAALLGIRETRRIRGEYRLGFEDYRRRADFPDEIGRCCYPVDIHSSSTDAAEQERVARVMRETAFRPGESYGIPYRVLIPLGLKNLLVPGRALSAEREVQSSLRVMPACFVTGQAAGLAAGLAGDGDARDIDLEALRRHLRALGAYFHYSGLCY